MGKLSSSALERYALRRTVPFHANVLDTDAHVDSAERSSAEHFRIFVFPSFLRISWDRPCPDRRPKLPTSYKVDCRNDVRRCEISCSRRAAIISFSSDREAWAADDQFHLERDVLILRITYISDLDIRYSYPEIWVRANEQTLNCWRVCSLGCMKAGVYKQTNMLQHFSMSKTCTHFAPLQTLRHECITIANKLSFPSVIKCCQVSGECLKNILRCLTLLKKYKCARLMRADLLKHVC